jgi:CheY-like chemotaxis protein
VLVVEDEAYVRESLDELLRARGFDVGLASGVAEAMTMLARTPVDVVLTDLATPAGAAELVRRARAMTPNTPIIVLTGHGNVASAVECMKAGATDYLLKPIDPDALEVALEKSLASRALEREVAYLRGAAGSDATAEPLGESPAWRRVMGLVDVVAPTGFRTVLLLGGRAPQGAPGAPDSSPEPPRPGRTCASTAPPCHRRCGERSHGHRRAFTGATAIAGGPGWRIAARCSWTRSAPWSPSAGQDLRVPQDGELIVWATSSRRVDVRLVAATNSDLKRGGAAGSGPTYYRSPSCASTAAAAERPRTSRSLPAGSSPSTPRVSAVARPRCRRRRRPSCRPITGPATCASCAISWSGR